MKPEQLIDREEEAQLLLELAEGGHNTRLSAPRRYGKTSLIRAVIERAEKIGMNTVYVNFYGTLSLEDAALKIEEAYRSSLHGPLRAWVSGALRTLRPTISPPGTGIKIATEFDNDAGRRLYSLLDMPVRVYKKDGSRTIVVFDEFQDVMQARPNIDGVIRSRIELHSDEASYIFSGSHPGMMAELFGDRSKPFYGQARLVPLSPLEDEDLADYITQRFTTTGKTIGEMMDPLLSTACGHPQRAMLLAHHLWEATKEGTEVDEECWSSAVEAVHRELVEGFVMLWTNLHESDRRVLAAIATESGSFSKKATLEKYELARATAIDAKDRLVASGHLEKRDRQVEFVDPLLSAWIAQDRSEL